MVALQCAPENERLGARGLQHRGVRLAQVCRHTGEPQVQVVVGLANELDTRPRGKPVQSWATTAALDALPPDAMRHAEFRHTTLQRAYQNVLSDVKVYSHMVRKPRPGKLSDL